MVFLLRNRKALLFIILGITVFLGIGMKNIRVDFSFDAFFPEDEELEFFESYRNTFAHDDNIIYVALENKGNSIFDLEFLNKVDGIFEEMRAIAHIDSVINPILLPFYKRTPGGVKKLRMFPLADSNALAISKERLGQDSLISTSFISRDKQYISGLLIMDPDMVDKPERQVVADELRRILAKYGSEDHVISGVPFIRTRYVEKIRSEMLYFVAGSYILVLIILLLTYRSWWGVVIPLAGVVMALIWTLGLMGWMNKPMGLMTELLSPILFVVGIANIIHLLTKYRQELEQGYDKETAILLTMKEIGKALFLTSISTAIGFGSLFISKLAPVREFGLIAAFGVLSAWIIAIVFVPNMITLINPEKIKTSKGVSASPIWNKVLLWIDKVTMKHKALIIGVFVGVVLVSGLGMSMISYNAYLLDDLGRNDPVRKSLAFFEDHFFGIREFEMAVIAKGDHKVTEIAILKEIDKMETFLKTEEEFGPFLSPVTYLKNANRLYHFSQERYNKLPSSQNRILEMLAFGIAEGGAEVQKLVISKDKKMARVNARMGDIGTDNFQILRDKLENFIATECNTELFEIHLTGSALMTERNVMHLRESLFQGLLLAFCLIGALMGWLFRSWKMIFFALIPNTIPLLATAAFMGFTGISLKASTSIIFVISFGIAVDDTIHFLSRLRMELSLGKDIHTAVHDTLQGTGRALILTTFVLVSGFVLLLFSSFGGTFLVGLFTTITLFLGLLADLFLLPVLVRWVFRKKNHSIPIKETAERKASSISGNRNN